MTKLKKPHEVADMSRAVYLYERYELTPSEVQRINTKAITQDRQHILEVLKEGVEEMKLTYVFSGVNWKDTDMESNQVTYGYNQAIKDVEALLQETLGEGKDYNYTKDDDANRVQRYGNH